MHSIRPRLFVLRVYDVRCSLVFTITQLRTFCGLCEAVRRGLATNIVRAVDFTTQLNLVVQQS